ncbi:hypothetical protein AB0B28_03135 [Glycomyces sp. NPDC046736]|uniref:hypothetical protein n=1 Tax=Glycomyces sp. NPDC046736 TaxID=3155615 RepID=UPI0033DEA635
MTDQLPGDRLDLVLADSTEISPEIAATYERGFGFGPIALAADLRDLGATPARSDR